MPRELLQLLADGNIHSGESLGQALGLSRAGVWKQIQKLHGLGVQIASAKGVGYRLERVVELLDSPIIMAALTVPVKKMINELDIQWSIPSTNSHCQHLLQRSSTCCICLAEHQSNGRGRRGRTWISPLASNIYMSVGWRFYGGIEVLEGLSLAVGMAVVDALRIDYGIEQTSLKWPNDVLYGNKKLGGILIEMSGDASGPCDVVVGLGLNVCLAAEAAGAIEQPWIDLEHLLEKTPSRNQLVSSILNRMLPLLSTFESLGFRHYAKSWPSYDGLHGQLVTLNLADNKTAVGQMAGVTDKGELILDVAGTRKIFCSAEVSFHRG